jgi:hypothetical protein
MTRLRPTLVSALVASACASQLDVGLGAADSGTTGDAVDSTTTSTATSESDASVDGTTTTSDTGTTGDTTSDTSGSTGESEGLEDSPCVSEQKVCAQVELDGEPAGFCGQTLELHGFTQVISPGRWSIEDCDACSRCEGEIYEVEFLGPADWVPTELPPCSRIAIDFAPLDDSPFACAFMGVAVWAEVGDTEDPAPTYVAASITTDPPAALGGLQVSKENVEPKPCDRSACCHEEPGKYVVTFGGAGIGAPIALAEHEEALDVGAFGATYALRNERSHSHVECGRIPHFDWILHR